MVTAANGTSVGPEQRQLRTRRLLLLAGGGGYLGWWLLVRVALPYAFNPLTSRLLCVGCFLAVFVASYVSSAVARRIGAGLTLACTISTAHYFYLFDRNHGDLNWVVGSFILVTAVCAILQSSRSLLFYTVSVVGFATVAVARQPEVPAVVFLPGLTTTLLFANVGLHARLRLLKRLQESHARVESVFDAGFDGIAVHHGGVVREVNAALGSLLGCEKGELIGRDVMTLIAPEARGKAADLIAGRLEGTNEVEALRCDGTHVTVELIGKPHVLDGIEMQQLAFRDLTERRRGENALVIANRELEAFSYSVAHDLRSPLRAIQGFSRVLVDDHGSTLTEEGKHLLLRVANAAETMGRLIDALLALARLTRTEVKRETVDLSVLAKEVADEIAEDREVRSRRPVAFERHENIVVDGDPRLLRSLIENLFDNAWKFTSKRTAPRVVFGSKIEDGVRVFFVRDNGAGFDMAHAQKLFGAFQRLHAPSEFPGTGIGLATVRRVVEGHGGRIWAEGAVDEGAVFYFTLGPGDA